MSAPISSVGSSIWRTRTEKSPRANFREAAAISSRGFAIRLEYMRETRSATMNTTAAIMAATHRNVFHASKTLLTDVDTKA